MSGPRYRPHTPWERMTRRERVEALGEIVWFFPAWFFVPFAIGRWVWLWTRGDHPVGILQFLAEPMRWWDVTDRDARAVG